LPGFYSLLFNREPQVFELKYHVYLPRYFTDKQLSLSYRPGAVFFNTDCYKQTSVFSWFPKT